MSEHTYDYFTSTDHGHTLTKHATVSENGALRMAFTMADGRRTEVYADRYVVIDTNGQRWFWIRSA